MLGACSDDDPVVRPVPNDPVQTVPSQADHVTLNAPAQSSITAEASLYRVSYANGQEVVYSFASDPTEGYIAIIKKIEGTAADVVIPASVSYNDMTLTVFSLDLYQHGMSDNVTSLTLPNTAQSMYTASGYVAADANHFKNQIAQGNGLQKIELEDGFQNFCTINGAIYTSDYTTLVSVPRAYPGTLTIAENTTIISERAMNYCSQLEVITIPAGVTEIGDQAVTFNNNLLLINCLAPTAPIATFDAFGTYAHNGVLRIPAGAEDNYKFTKPDLKLPKEPVEPDEDATEEEEEAYQEALDQYQIDKAEYDEVMKNWNDHEGWALFKNIEGVNF